MFWCQITTMYSSYISFGSHTSLMEIYRKSHLRNSNINVDDAIAIINIIFERLECDAISIQYIKTLNIRLQGVYANSLYTELSKINLNK